ncbi:DUF5050 domain-containing protein [Desnuesiella massiliensis]|uniref:DUF5050 domain-containing protein n=1 Tax=Desnuesiella massiliensis TaxID=1650662 RepID=UPI0006E30FEE|nr:DUF5050 domain-containing protein [Desnuesiella massiliensis]
MKIKKFLAIFLLAMLLIAGNVYSIKAAGNVKILDSKYNIAPNHEFTVKFSQEIDETSIKEGTVKIYEKATLKPIEIVIRKDINDPYNLKVKGKNEFEKGKTYTLEVRDLKSKKNKYTKQITKMDFTVKNLYSGLPAENGLIIVDDKAYAIDYLIKNITMVNEIITKTYDIYYTYDVNYEKIYSLFKTGPITGNSTTIKNEITYVDPNGNRSLYKYRTDRGEYQLVEPKASVDVIVRSDANAVNLNVNSVSAIPEAKYYKVRNSNMIKSFGEPILYMALSPTEELSILSSDKTVLAKGTVFVDRNNNGEVRLRLAETLALGNTAGNINNNGIAVGDGEGYTYYVNNADKEKLYKLGMDSGYNRMILEDKAQYINEAGDWIYYSNYNDGGKLYKVKKDGTERQKMLDDKAAYTTIAGEYIYYSNHTDGGRLYKVRKDGADIKINSDNTRHGNALVVDYGDNKKSDEVAYINVVGDWIYYSNYSDGHKLFVIHKDGTYRGKISDTWADCVQVVGDWIYLTSGSGVIGKVNKAGDGNVIPIRATANQYDKGYHINAVGDWIFYSNAEDGGKLYKINTDGSGSKVKLGDEPVGYINVIGDWIYFNTTKGKLFRLPINSNGEYKPEEVGASKDNNQISEIQDVYVSVDFADVNKSTEFIENKYLPNKIPAIMKDNTMQQLVVVWDTNPSKVSFKDGVRIYTGSVVGYNKAVKLYMTIPSEMLNDTNMIYVYKNGNKNDMIRIEGNLDPTNDKNSIRTRMKEGDTIKVYEDAQKKRLLGSSKVGKDGKVTVSKLDLDSYGKSFYITITRVNKAESNPTEIKQYATPIIKADDVMDKDFEGLGADIRDITINNWIQAQWNPYEENYLNKYYKLIDQSIYVLPSKTLLDMDNNIPIEAAITLDKKQWDGSLKPKEEAIYKNKDSRGNILKTGRYDLYVASSFTGLGSPDVDNRQPFVEGKIANAIVPSFDLTSEGIPAKPTIKVQRVQGYDVTKPNIYVNLDKPLLPGETAWLVPVSELDAVRGWRAEISLSPFEELLKQGKDLVKFTGPGTKMPSPLGDRVSSKPIDIEYKLFIVNGVGASVESDNKITVDNSVPSLTVEPPIKGVNYNIGDPISVRMDDGIGRKGKVYIVDSGIKDYEIATLEAVCNAKNGLWIQHSGSNTPIPVYGSENLLSFTSKIGISTNITYNVVAVDEAGNITAPIPITISRNFDGLEGALSSGYAEIKKAAEAGIVLKELSDSVRKGEAIKVKPNVKQSEIEAIINEIMSRIGGLSTDTSLSSKSSNIIVQGNLVSAAQMPIRDFLKNVFNKNGAVISVLDSSGNQITDEQRLIEKGMKVKVTAQSGSSLPGYYDIQIVIANPNNGEELKAALMNEDINTIWLLSSEYELNLTEDIIVNRPIKIESSSFSGKSKIKLSAATGKIINKSKLQIKNVIFTGNISDGLIENQSDLSIISSTFDKLNFNTGFNNVFIIKSQNANRLYVNQSTFSNINSGEKDLAVILLNAGLDNTVENSSFTSISGRNAKGVSIGGQTSNNEVLIKNNSFTKFVAGVVNSIATPIYVDGGNINLTANTINTSESGIWIDAYGENVRVGILTIKADNASSIAKTLSSTNSYVKGNSYGDVVINIPNKLPVVYYNPALIAPLDSVDFIQSGGIATLKINDKLSAGNKIYYAVDNMVKVIPNDYNTIIGNYTLIGAAVGDSANNIDVSTSKFIAVAEVNPTTKKIVKFRQIYIP